MSAELFGGEITVPTGDPKNLQTLLEEAAGALVATRQTFCALALRADIGNAGNVAVGLSSAVTMTSGRIGFMQPSETWEAELPGVMTVDRIWLKASAANSKVLVAGIGM